MQHEQGPICSHSMTEELPLVNLKCMLTSTVAGCPKIPTGPVARDAKSSESLLVFPGCGYETLSNLNWSSG